jgi:cell division protein FtsN
MHRFVLTLGLAALFGLAACSRQQGDWEKTRAANTTDAYELFLKQYPSGEFTAQAQARLKELYEQRDWQKARDIDSPEAYQAFLKQYPEGKWSEEARIRIENFTLATAPSNSPVDAPTAKTPAAPARAAPARAAPATAAVPARAAPARVKKGGNYAVQLGAFKSGTVAANQRWTQLSAKYPSLLHGLSPKVTPRQDSSGTLYRLQVLNLSPKRARAICKRLKAHSQACVVLTPNEQRVDASGGAGGGT